MLRANEISSLTEKASLLLERCEMARKVTSDDRRVALFRGINVGKAKRLAMADLRRVATDLGYSDVKTVLNSGNLIFTVPPGQRGEPDELIEKAVAEETGIKSKVTQLTAKEMEEAIRDNPLAQDCDNLSRLHAAVLRNPKDRVLLEPLQGEDWGSEKFVLGKRVAYIWCPDGMLQSRLPEAVGRALGDGVTLRNWATMTKISAAMR